MRLNWFSPLLPERTDIAHYTARCSAALQKHFDVVYWTSGEYAGSTRPDIDTQAYTIETINTPNLRRRLFEGVNLYNIGNDVRFHGAIFQVLNKIPGIVILHDAKLHDFIRGFYNDNDYIEAARRYYGQAGASRATDIVSGRATINQYIDVMPFTEAFLENAIAVICHSKSVRAEISALKTLPILDLALPFTSLAERPKSVRVWAPPYKLIMFGFIGMNRRLETILQALACFPGKALFHLEIYGTLWDESHIKGLIASLGLRDIVKVHGYVPERQLDEAIAASHLAFNLRFPTMGESSGGILRSWTQATPTLVTAEGWYRYLPDSVTDKISVKNECGDIHAALAQLCDRPTHFEQMGINAQNYVRMNHSPEYYVEQLKTALVDFQHMGVRHAARSMLQSAASHLQIGERELLAGHAAVKIASVFGR